MEEFTEIKTLKINYLCQDCHKGFLIATGKLLFSNPPQFIHTCSHCNEKTTLSKKYPYTIQKEIPYEEK